MMLTRPRPDDRGSLPMAMLIITLGLAISAALAPVVVRQIVMTRSLTDRNAALNAAQSGLDVMMSWVRAASDDDESGLVESLPPCTVAGDAGVTGAGESLKYSVTIAYQDSDGSALPCPTTDVPTTAVVTSSGTLRNYTRVLTATYVFTTNNSNIPGGKIEVRTTTTFSNLCMDSGGARVPPAGTKIVLKTCNGSTREQFGYTNQLYLKLINSESSTASDGMCLSPGSGFASGSFVTFQLCPANLTAIFQWALDGQSRFQPTKTNGTTDTSLCMAPNGSNTLIITGSCTPSTTAYNIWRSGTGVGAGMAGDATDQLVNYEQFSRCLDVTSQDTSKSYMIAWFCKQSPDGVVDWNQRWVHPTPTPPATSATGNIVVTKSGTPYCLKSPLSSAATIYATVVACTTANRPNPELQWTVYHDTGDYASSYRIVDDSGFCLTPTDQDAVPPDTHTDGTSKVKVAVCDDTELQKWDAPPNINKPTPLTDLIEK